MRASRSIAAPDETEEFSELPRAERVVSCRIALSLEEAAGFCAAPSAAISGGQMIGLGSPESEVQFVIVEPGNAGIDVLVLEYLGQVLIMFF